MKTLFERIFEPLDLQARKHKFGQYYAENEINDMTQFDFLQKISDELSEMLDELKKEESNG